MTIQEASMTTETGKSGASTTADVCPDEALQAAIEALQAAVKSSKKTCEQDVLQDCVKLLKDVCIMMHGFGAAVKAKANSR
jgi:hypothetical protein